jgi:hypothetical protein
MKYIIVMRVLFSNEPTQLNQIGQDRAGFQIPKFRKKKNIALLATTPSSFWFRQREKKRKLIHITALKITQVA